MQGKHIIGLSVVALIVMGILYFTFLKPDPEAQQIYNEMMEVFKQADAYKEMSMEEILSQEVNDEVLDQIYMHLSEKCEYGMELDRCNEVEKTFYLLYDFHAEVGNGGIEQFIYNCYENKEKTLDIFKESQFKNSYIYLLEALNLYPDKRVDIYEDTYLMEELGKLDDKYYDLHESEYYRYIYDYVKNHKQSFMNSL